MTKPYIAASSYLNAAPLCYSFIYGEQKERCTFLSDAAPSRCAALLDEGRADAALIPVIEYQRIRGLKIASGACVASKVECALGRAGLACAYSGRALGRARYIFAHIGCADSDNTWALLWSQPLYTTAPPRIAEMLESSDAALIIGDPAMLIDRSRLHIYDLAEEWRKHTGLPFVFAFWAIRSDSGAWPDDHSLCERVDFRAAKREGVEHTRDLANIYSVELGLPREDLIKYLTENISYDLDEECLSGLKLYYELALECGLIEEARGLDFSG